MTILYVGLGGAVGAILRYLVTILSARMFGLGFPYGTLMVNILGAFLMGMLVSAGASHFNLSQDMRLFLQVGVLGGFTTFSAFSLDVVTLFERGETISAGAYIMLSIVLSVIAITIGMMVFRP